MVGGSRSSVRDLVVIFGATFGAAAIGAAASINAPEFYAQLAKPSWAPTADVFGPVWTVLYILMAVAAWLAVRAGAPASNAGSLLWLYVAQLGLNALWSWLFFRWRLGAAASVEVVALCACVVWTTVRFWRVRGASGVLMLPYALWVVFASALTVAVWRLNPRFL